MDRLCKETDEKMKDDSKKELAGKKTQNRLHKVHGRPSCKSRIVNPLRISAYHADQPEDRSGSNWENSRNLSPL